MKNCAKLHIWSLGLAIGVVWAVAVFFVGLISGWCEDWGREFVTMIGSVYYGYTASFLGSIIGLIWGFIDGFIGGVVIAWLYNFFCCCCCRECGTKTEGSKTEVK